jgi:hypothetical protein
MHGVYCMLSEHKIHGSCGIKTLSMTLFHLKSWDPFHKQFGNDSVNFLVMAVVMLGLVESAPSFEWKMVKTLFEVV